eukprot:Opistho-2@4133
MDAHSNSQSIERTYAMIKPDAIQHADEIIDIILRKGFKILQKKRVQLSQEQVADFYAEHQGKPFYEPLVAFMSSGPIYALVLARENAILKWRELMGPTDSVAARESAPGSIRALFGTNNRQNAVHGSDSVASANREIRFIFPDSLLYPIATGPDARDYLAKNVNPTLLQGLTELCKKKPADPLTWLAQWLLRNNPNKPQVVEPEDR